MANLIPKEAKNDLATTWLAATETTWKVALFRVGSDCLDNKSLYSDCSLEVAHGSGYETGGATLSRLPLSYSGNTVIFDASNVSWATATFTAAYAVVYHTATSKIRAIYDFGGAKTVTGGTFTIQWNAGGLIQIS